MDPAKVCPKCNSPMVYHIEEKVWTCEQCEGGGKWTEDGIWNRIKRSGPFQFFFGPMQFEKATRKATLQLIKGLRGLLLGAGLVLALLMFYSNSKAVVCCTVYGVLIGIIGISYVFRSARSIRNVKDPEDPKAAKGYKFSFHYIFPNFLVISCFLILAFMALVDILTLGTLDKSNLVVEFLHGIRGVSWILKNYPILLPIILWYSATRAMIMAYYQAFDSGRSIAFKNHDRRLTAGYRTDKWYKRVLIKGARGVGMFSTGLSIFYAMISFGLFILNLYLFGRESRNQLFGGWLAGWNIIYIELACLVILFIATLWVTTYSIAKRYPTTVFTTWGMMSNKMKVDPNIAKPEAKGGKVYASTENPAVTTVKKKPRTGEGMGKTTGKASSVSKGSKKGGKKKADTGKKKG